MPLAAGQGSEEDIMKELQESGSNRRICVTMQADVHVIAFARRLMAVLAPNIRAAATEATQGVAAVLAMLRELAMLPYTSFMLLQPLPGSSTPVIDHVIAILGTNNVSLAAGKACLEILQFLLQSVCASHPTRPHHNHIPCNCFSVQAAQRNNSNCHILHSIPKCF